MPELPEVENFKRYFEKTSLNRDIKKIDTIGRKTLSKISAEELNKELRGKSFKSADRHGKYLFAFIDDDITVMMHFGMTGELEFYEQSNEPSSGVRARFIFSDGSELTFHDYRMFGRISLTKNIEEFINEHKLGPDPINNKFTAAMFKEIALNKNGLAKVVLMDQNTIAGIGNIYSDEILFQSGVHPEARLNKLEDKRLEEVYRNIKKILKDSIKYVQRDGNFPELYLINKRKNGEECPVCGGEIKMKTIGGRSSYFCTKHQKK